MPAQRDRGRWDGTSGVSARVGHRGVNARFSAAAIVRARIAVLGAEGLVEHAAGRHAPLGVGADTGLAHGLGALVRRHAHAAVRLVHAGAAVAEVVGASEAVVAGHRLARAGTGGASIADRARVAVVARVPVADAVVLADAEVADVVGAGIAVETVVVLLAGPHPQSPSTAAGPALTALALSAGVVVAAGPSVACRQTLLLGHTLPQGPQGAMTSSWRTGVPAPHGREQEHPARGGPRAAGHGAARGAAGSTSPSPRPGICVVRPRGAVATHPRFGSSARITAAPGSRRAGRSSRREAPLRSPGRTGRDTGRAGPRRARRGAPAEPEAQAAGRRPSTSWPRQCRRARAMDAGRCCRRRGAAWTFSPTASDVGRTSSPSRGATAAGARCTAGTCA